MTTAKGVKLGDLLVGEGVLTYKQVDAILEQQAKCGRPFGFLAEQMFDVRPECIEKAWIQQYLSFGTEVDLDDQQIDVDALKVINRRQAWQFRLLPLRREDDELLMATDQDHLPKAVNFAWRRLHDPVFFLVAKRPQLEDFLAEHYPWPQMEGFDEYLAAS